MAKDKPECNTPEENFWKKYEDMSCAKRVVESILDQLDQRLRYYDFSGDKIYDMKEVKYLLRKIFNYDEKIVVRIYNEYFS